MLPTTHSGIGHAAVVFVHGVLDRGGSFADVAALLDERCTMRWYDRRGYGAGFDPAVEPVGVPTHVDDLIEVLDGEPAVLAAHSFGGVIALGAAARAPELVRAVVCYESVLPWATGWDDSTMQQVIGSDDPEWTGLQLMAGDRLATLTPEQLARRRALAAVFVAEERSVRIGGPAFDVAAIRAPIVYGRSDLDRIAPIPAYLRSHAPGRVDEVVIDGAGHDLHRSDPTAYADLVVRALDLAER